jgi:hypothetical protein
VAHRTQFHLGLAGHILAQNKVQIFQACQRIITLFELVEGPPGSSITILMVIHV